MKAERLPSGKWRVRVYLGKENGKPVHKSVTADSKQEALRQAALYEPKKALNMTVEEACERFIELREKELSPSTLRGYKGTLDAYVKNDVIAAVKLDRLTSVIFQDWVNRMDVSKKTKKNHLGFVLAVVRFFEIDKVFRVRIAKEEKKEMYTPTMEEINLVMEYADEELKRAICLACFGLRRGEICALTSDDFDRKRNTVRISKAYAKTPENCFVLKSPKTMKSVRIVPISPEVIDMMPEGRIITCSPDCITNRFAKAVERAGVKKFRFHDLRSFFASTALSTIGSASRTVQDLGGWQTDRVMKSHYDRSISDQFQKDSEAIVLYFTDHLKMNTNRAE